MHAITGITYAAFITAIATTNIALAETTPNVASTMDIAFTTQSATLEDGHCGGKQRHLNQPNFQTLVQQDRITAQGFRISHGEQGQFRCTEHYRIVFDNVAEQKAFYEQQALPGYAFADIDYVIFQHGIEQAALDNDEYLYRLFMIRDTRNAVSEDVPPLFAKLRDNPQMFLKTFAENLSPSEQDIALAQQYDFNRTLSDHLFEHDAGNGLDSFQVEYWNTAMTAYYQAQQNPIASR